MQIKTETRVGLFVLGAVAVFFYMTMNLGVFRLNRGKYKPQVVYFNDVSGLEKKSVVKIAGVPIGWVDRVELVPDHAYLAKADIMILKEYILHTDSFAIVRQDGLLGTKFLEVVPGDPSAPELEPGQALGKPGKSPASLDDVLQNFSQAAQKIAAFSEILDRTLSNNEENINLIMSDFRDFARELKNNVPAMGNDITRLSDRLEFEFLPSVQQSIEKISQVFDRDFSRFSDSIQASSSAIEEVALEARDGFKHFNSLTQKIDNGTGLIGKLINEEETYHDIKFAVGGLRNYFAKVDNLSIVLDSHGEYLFRPAEHMTVQDNKGYIDIRVHPTDDHFYLLQLVSTIRGNIQRTTIETQWFGEDGKPIESRTLLAAGHFPPIPTGTVDTLQRTYDQFKYGLQIGKIFKNLVLRFGLIENSAGVGLDFQIPFPTDKFRWITSIEGFDFRGRDRINDDRPHLKWMNRVFVLRNIYMAFGIDDFVSKHNANAISGLGIRFCDDDLKYIVSKIGFAGIISGD